MSNEWVNRKDFKGDETVLCDAVMVDICCRIFVKTHRMYNPCVCQCRFTDSGKCVSVVEGLIQVWELGMQDISLHVILFFCNLKLVWK